MNKNQKGFAAIVLIVLVAVLVGVVGYFVLVKKTPEVTQETLLSTPTTTPVAPVPNKKVVATPQPTDAPRVIACNPKGFDPDYFKKEKPCASDMSSVDLDRENKALSVITNAKKTDKTIPFDASAKLLVSDKRYQVIDVNLAPSSGFVVVDTVAERVTDYFSIVGNQFVENSSSRFIFLGRLSSSQMTTGDFVRQYTFGREKSVTLASTEVYYPQTYFYEQGPEGSASVKIITSTPGSMTLGVYDQNKPLPQKPGDDFVTFTQVGTKVINLSN